jgi:MATE family multidrug resistance protein
MMKLTEGKEEKGEHKALIEKDKKRTIISNEGEGDKVKQIHIIKSIAKLAVPSVFSSLIVYSLETINLMFASHFNNDRSVDSKDLINAIGIGNVFMNFSGFLFGLGMITALETLCSQSYGKNDTKELAKWAKICQYFMFGYFILLALLSVFSEHLIMLLGQERRIAKLASSYVFSLIPSFILQFFLAIYTKVLNSQQIYNPILYINFICILLHPLWCYIFFTVLEMPRYGLGISYSLTSLLMLIMTYFYTSYKKAMEDVSLRDCSWKEFKIFLKTSLTCGVLCSTDVLGFELISFISGYLPQNELDANICVINIYNNIYSISLGFSTALTTLTGNFMGENKPRMAMKYVKMGVLMNFSLIMVISLLCIFLHKYIALLYIKNGSILRYSSNLMRVVGIFIIFDAIQLILSGIIRGIGRQTIGMIVGLTIFIFIQTGLCSIFVFWVNFGVWGLWLAQIICGIIACIVYLIILKKTNWNEMAEIASRAEIEEDSENKVASRKKSLITNEHKGSYILAYNSNSSKESQLVSSNKMNDKENKDKSNIDSPNSSDTTTI